MPSRSDDIAGYADSDSFGGSAGSAQVGRTAQMGENLVDPAGGMRDEVTGDPDGIDRPTYSMQERLAHEASVNRASQDAAAERAAERAAEETAEAEAERIEQEMADAHARGEAYRLDDVEHNGETVEQWVLPDGTTVLRDDDGDIVSVTYPPGGEPEYQGDMIFDGEICAIFELASGAIVAVNSDGDLVGFVDDLEPDSVDLEPDTMWVDKFLLTDDVEDIGEMVEVYTQPKGPPSYDTVVVDAETGKTLTTWDTGSHNPYTGYSTYVPAGAETGFVIEPSGNIVGIYDPPPEEEWSILGVTYYDDGSVSVDLGVVDVNVDLTGSEMSIDVTVDILVATVGAGLEWSEDGSWTFTGEFDADVEGVAFGAGMEFGRDDDGMAFFNGDTYVEMNLYGAFTLEGGQYLTFQQTDEGFESSMGLEGSLTGLGIYVEHNQDFTLVLDKAGLTGTYTDVIGLGIEGLGGFEVAHQVQGRTDGTLGGTDMGVGQHYSVVDEYGGQVAGGGLFLDTEHGFYFSEDRMDDGTSWTGSTGLPTGPDGGVDDAFTFDDGRAERRAFEFDDNPITPRDIDPSHPKSREEHDAPGRPGRTIELDDDLTTPRSLDPSHPKWKSGDDGRPARTMERSLDIDDQNPPEPLEQERPIEGRLGDRMDRQPDTHDPRPADELRDRSDWDDQDRFEELADDLTAPPARHLPGPDHHVIVGSDPLPAPVEQLPGPDDTGDIWVGDVGNDITAPIRSSLPDHHVIVGGDPLPAAPVEHVAVVEAIDDPVVVESITVDVVVDQSDNDIPAHDVVDAAMFDGADDILHDQLHEGP